jgi:HlyD family secretion protein
LEIVSDLLSTDAVKVRPGQQVGIERWGGGHPLRGRVQRIEPSGFTKISALGVEEQRVNVIINFEDPRAAWAALGDAFRVEVRIIVWERGDVLKVPTSSLFRRGEKWAVFTVQQNKAILREVEIGQRNDTDAELLSGLTEGAQVIVHPSDAVADGVAVAPRSP